MEMMMTNLEEIKYLCEVAKRLKLTSNKTSWFYNINSLDTFMTVDSCSVKEFICKPNGKLNKMMNNIIRDYPLWISNKMINYEAISQIIKSSKDETINTNDLIKSKIDNTIGIVPELANDIIYRFDCNRKKLLDFGVYNTKKQLVYYNKPNVVVEKINEDEKFRNIIFGKADDGANYYIVDNHHIIYLFSSLLPCLKNDIINISIYDNSESFTVCFTIEKSDCIVNVYCDYLYL